MYIGKKCIFVGEYSHELIKFVWMQLLHPMCAHAGVFVSVHERA